MNAEELLAALNAERYGTGEWFTGRPRTQPQHDDSELTTARRRRELLADVAHQTRTA